MKYVTIKSINRIKCEPRPVFDMTVPGNSNFFANNILIHNCTDYHHGVVSLVSTVTGMATTKIPGSNNMNLFEPKGQFGSRLTKEAGAGRYIFTHLSKYFRRLFPKADDVILVHNYTDGQKIEPKFFLPILPLVLINGATGTGTGHSCEIKSYHPLEIRDACVKVIDGKKLTPNTLVPWFRGFNGTVERNPETGQVITRGKLKVLNSTTIQITEIPIGKFVDDYKDVLNKLEDEGFIKSYDDTSSEETFMFTITTPRTTTALDEESLYTKFKLVSRDTENLTLWTPDDTLKRYNNVEEIIENYVNWRVGFYEIRRTKLINDLQETIRYQSEIVRFIKFFMANHKLFRDTDKQALINLLLENKFVDYEKLLSMPIWTLTKDRIDDLMDKIEVAKNELAELQQDTAHKMYRRELMAFKYTKEDESVW